MPRIARPLWSAEETALLTLHYPTLPHAELLALLPKRNAHAIHMKASSLDLLSLRPHPRAWSDEHMAILREHYPTKGAAYVANLVGRTTLRVNGQASKYQIAYTGTRNPKRPMHGPELAKNPVGRPKKNVTEPKPIKATPPKVAAPQKPAAAPPAKRTTSTPLLDARAAQKRQDAQAQAQKPKAFVTAAEVRNLRADHPARWAYTVNAYKGPAAASEAFRAAMQQQS